MSRGVYLVICSNILFDFFIYLSICFFFFFFPEKNVTSGEPRKLNKQGDHSALYGSTGYYTITYSTKLARQTMNQ